MYKPCVFQGDKSAEFSYKCWFSDKVFPFLTHSYHVCQLLEMDQLLIKIVEQIVVQKVMNNWIRSIPYTPIN